MVKTSSTNSRFVLIPPEIIKLIWVVNGYTQNEVAKKAGTSLSLVNLIEQGKTPLRGSILEVPFYEMFNLDDRRLALMEALYREIIGS